MKTLAFVWYFDRASQIIDKWRDGLTGAIEKIAEDHEVDAYLDENTPPEDYDAYLIWGDVNCPAIQLLKHRKGKKGIILTSDNDIWRDGAQENLKALDVIFCESVPVYEAVRRGGHRAIKAFGTDTDFYKPSSKVKKDIEYFYPATFSPWKKQDEISYLGKKLLCVGTIQPDGQEIYSKCLKNGVKCEVGYFDARVIRNYYQRAKKVIIPAIHGSERTVLEGMACDILPMVLNEKNIRTLSYLKEFEESKLKSPREFVLKNYSHLLYAEKIQKNLLQ